MKLNALYLVSGCVLYALASGMMAPAAANVVNQGGPVIYSVNPLYPLQTETLVISGTGFGSQAAYSGDSDYIQIIDETRHWSAGNTKQNDLVTLNIRSWTNSQIVVTGFGGSYGGNGGQWVLDPGDLIEVRVGNPTLGIKAFQDTSNGSKPPGPGICLMAVASGLPCSP